MYEENSNKVHHQSTLIEWKELARKIEFIFCIFSFISITVASIVLFHDYFMEDYGTDLSYLNQMCMCVHVMHRSLDFVLLKKELKS